MAEGLNPPLATSKTRAILLAILAGVFFCSVICYAAWRVWNYYFFVQPLNAPKTTIYFEPDPSRMERPVSQGALI
jgi:hypothetical protein